MTQLLSPPLTSSSRQMPPALCLVLVAHTELRSGISEVFTSLGPPHSTPACPFMVTSFILAAPDSHHQLSLPPPLWISFSPAQALTSDTSHRSSLCLFFIPDYLFRHSWVLRNLYVFWIPVLYLRCALERFLTSTPGRGLSFHSLNSAFAEQIFLILMKCSLSFFMDPIFDVSKKSSLNPGSPDFLPLSL